MRKLDTPLGALLTVALMMIYAVYSFLEAAIEGSWPLVSAGLIAIVAPVATAALRQWCRYLVHGLAVAFMVEFAHSIYAGASVGHFRGRFYSSWDDARPVVPGSLLFMLCGACCPILHRHLASCPASGRNNSI